MESKRTDFSSSLNMRGIQILNKEIKRLVGNKHHSEAWMHFSLSTNVILIVKFQSPLMTEVHDSALQII